MEEMKQQQRADKQNSNIKKLQGSLKHAQEQTKKKLEQVEQMKIALRKLQENDWKPADWNGYHEDKDHSSKKDHSKNKDQPKDKGKKPAYHHLGPDYGDDDLYDYIPNGNPGGIPDGNGGGPDDGDGSGGNDGGSSHHDSDHSDNDSDNQDADDNWSNRTNPLHNPRVHHHQHNILSNLKLPTPQKFDGSHRVSVEDWIYNLEIFFDAARAQDHEKVTYAIILLIDMAQIWWKNLRRRNIQPTTWTGFCREIRNQF